VNPLCMCGKTALVVPTYMDDCHIIARTREGIQHIQAELQKRFKLHDMGPTNWFLGIDIQHNCSTCQITLSQRQYSIDMLKDFGLEDCAPVKTPMVPGLRLERPTTPLSPEEIEFHEGQALSACNWQAHLAG